MPVILDEQDYEPWLDADQQDRRRLEPLLKPYDSSKMTLDPVSKYVNNVCHESPECIKIQRELF
jgi:putative SOS response-associated peptidase YedK